MNEYPNTWSLGTVSEDLGSDDQEPTLENMTVHDRALRNWCRLVYYFTVHDLKEPATWRRPSKEHMLSYQLLLDWWTGAYHDPALSYCGVTRVLGTSFLETFLQDDLVGLPIAWNDIIRSRLRLPLAHDSLALLTDLAFQKEHILTPQDLGGYQDALCLLFESELLVSASDDVDSESQVTIDARHNSRKDAAITAYCQQFAWKAFCSYRGEDPTGRARKRSVFSSRHTNSGMLNLALHGPIVNPCSWLQNHISEDGDLPFYLWDIRKGCTVESSSISISPEYIAISHTWGRWLKDRPVKIPGVPWDVLQNKHFNVRDIREILRRLVRNTRCGVKYV